MPITAPTTLGTNFSGFLTREQAEPIFQRAARVSVAQSLARQVPLGGTGASVPVVTGRLTAGWVAEGERKPASAGAMALKTMDPRKLATVAVVSAEVVRANPGGYMDIVRDQVADAFAVGFDNAAFHDAGPDGVAGAGPFASWLDQTTKSVELGSTTQANGGIHGDLVAALTLLVSDGKKLGGFALDDKLEPLLWGAVDTTGRSLFTDLTDPAGAPGVARPGRLLNRPSYLGEGVSLANTVLGYAGDWTQAAWGVVGGITYSLSTEASVTVNGVLVSLWENNLVAIRAEAEYGWLVNDPASFVKLANVTP